MAGELKTLVCSSCSMWQAGDSSSPRGQHVCRKCLQPQLLEAQVSDLERRLGTLQNIGRLDLYKLDRLHLGRTGTDVLGSVFTGPAGEGLNEYAKGLGNY
eukprot:g38926.t1